MKYIVSISGGKDSTALLLWAIAKYGKRNLIIIFADTGAEFEETYEYLEYLELKQGIKIFHIKNEKWDWFSYSRHRQMLPDSQNRFCTSKCKTDPTSKWITANCTRKEDIFLTGERWEESGLRAGYSHQYFNKDHRIKGLRPILHWTVADVLRCIREAGLELHPIYKHFYRLGCYCCIFNSQSEWVQLYRYYPHLFEKAAKFEEELGYTFKQGETLRQLINRCYNPNQGCEFDEEGSLYHMAMSM